MILLLLILAAVITAKVLSAGSLNIGMRCSVLINFIVGVMFVSSCSPAVKGGVKYPEPHLGVGEKIILYDTVPSLNTFDFVLSHMGRDLSGVLIIKVSESNHKRIVMTSLYGMTLLDFELTAGGTLKLNYSIEQLNRKRILDLLRRDFETLFSPYKTKGIKFLYGAGLTIEALTTGRGITALVMRFNNLKDGFPSQIIMDHPRLKLSLKLEKTNYTSNESDGSL